MTGSIVRVASAWDSIGWDDGPFRVKGGRAVYEAVLYNCANGAANVKLARLETASVGGCAVIREVSRYVPPETMLEFLRVPPTFAGAFRTVAPP